MEEESHGERDRDRGPLAKGWPRATLHVVGEPDLGWLAATPRPSSHQAVLGWLVSQPMGGYGGHTPPHVADGEKGASGGGFSGGFGGVVWLRAVRGIKIKCICSQFIFLLQADLVFSY
jgi:hypothetical protein